MMSRRSVLFFVALAFVTIGCQPKNYPPGKNPTASERVLTTVGYYADAVGKRTYPALRYGRRYDSQRQTTHIEYSYYMDYDFKGAPELFYLQPKGLPDVKFHDRKTSGFKAKRREPIEVDLIEWRSQYQPRNPDFVLYYEKYVDLHKARAIFVRAKCRRNRGVIVIAHPWTGRKLDLMWKDMKGPMLDYAQMGYDSVLIQLPYHGDRALHGAVFSGEHFISGELARVNEAMCQSVTDIRSMTAWLRWEHGYEVVGLKGDSLGATAALMTAVVDDGVDFVVAWKPLASIADLDAESPIAPYAIATLRASDLDYDLVKKVLYLSSPANFEPAIAVRDLDTGIDRVIIFAGMGDRFLGIKQPLMVQNRWDVKRLKWYAGGYMWNLQKGSCAKVEKEFLMQCLRDPAKTTESLAKQEIINTPVPTGDKLRWRYLREQYAWKNQREKLEWQNIKERNRWENVKKKTKDRNAMLKHKLLGTCPTPAEASTDGAADQAPDPGPEVDDSASSPKTTPGAEDGGPIDSGWSWNPDEN